MAIVAVDCLKCRRTSLSPFVDGVTAVSMFVCNVGCCSEWRVCDPSGCE